MHELNSFLEMSEKVIFIIEIKSLNNLLSAKKKKRQKTKRNILKLKQPFRNSNLVLEPFIKYRFLCMEISY